MAAIWSPETRFRIWFEIEAHAADPMAELGLIPKDAAKTTWQKGKAAKSDAAARAFRAPGNDVCRRLGSLPQRATRARRRSAHRRRGCAQCRSRTARERVQ